MFDLSEPQSEEINYLREFLASVVIRDAKYYLGGITVFIEESLMLVIFSIKRQIHFICMTDFVQMILF